MCMGYYVSGNPPHQVSSECLGSAEFTEVSYCPHRDADNVALRNDSALWQGLIKGWQVASVNMLFLPHLPHPGVAGQSNKPFLALILKYLLYCDRLPVKRGWSRITLASTQRNSEEREQEYPCEGRDFYWQWGKCALKWKGYGGQDKLPCWKDGIAFKIFPEHPFLLAENSGKFCISHSWSPWSIQVWIAHVPSHNAGTEDWSWSFCLSLISLSWMTCLAHLVPVHPGTCQVQDIHNSKNNGHLANQKVSSPQRLHSLDQQLDSTVRQHRHTHMSNQ